MVFQTNHQRIERCHVVCECQRRVEGGSQPQTLSARERGWGAANCRTIGALWDDSVRERWWPWQCDRTLTTAQRRIRPVGVEDVRAVGADLPRRAPVAERAVIGQRHAQPPASELGERWQDGMEAGRGHSGDEVAWRAARSTSSMRCMGRRAPGRMAVADAFGQQRVYCRLAFSPVP